MRRPLPPAPPEHEVRNQNELRRSVMQMLREIRARLDNIDRELENG